MDPEVLFVTEPHLKKPKLDDGVNDELETMNTLESFEQEKSTESDDRYKEELNMMEASDSDSDYETLAEQCTLRPQDFESGEKSQVLVELCESALAYYQKNHPEESYEFERGHGGFKFPHVAYRLEFLAKNLRKNGNPVRNFEASVFYLDYDSPEKFVVENCVRWKGYEVEPKFATDFQPVTPDEDLDRNESAEIIEFSKTSLEFYMKNNPGKSYEFVKIQKAKCWFGAMGVEYIIIFDAKKTEGGYCIHL